MHTDTTDEAHDDKSHFKEGATAGSHDFKVQNFGARGSRPLDLICSVLNFFDSSKLRGLDNSRPRFGDSPHKPTSHPHAVPTCPDASASVAPYGCVTPRTARTPPWTHAHLTNTPGRSHCPWQPASRRAGEPASKHFGISRNRTIMPYPESVLGAYQYYTNYSNGNL